MSIILALLAGPLAAHEGAVSAQEQRVEMHEREIAHGAVIPWHIHPGIEASYVIEGELELQRATDEVQIVSAGESFIVARAVPHTGRCIAESGCRVVVTYIIDSDLPTAIPVEEPTSSD